MTDEFSLAVLVSGGLDSAILLGESLKAVDVVHPLYVRCGLAWEPTEEQHLHRYLRALACPGLLPLHVLEMPVADLYGKHWSLSGQDVPDQHSPDEAVYLPGRNVLLLSKAMLWCHGNDVPAVALAPLATNPFPDATPAFFCSYAGAVNAAVPGKQVGVITPFLQMHKTEVMKMGRELPLELTFSCIRPIRDRHCGLCNKCAERRRAFAEAEMPDPTEYHEAPPPCTA